MKIMNRWLEGEKHKFTHASLLPPRHDPPPDRPESCLLDSKAYLASRKNATTASCLARGGRLVQVTFFPVHPPRLSYMCVCCPGPGKSPYDEFACEPNVVAAEADLVLIRMAFGPHHNRSDARKYDFFLYRAAAAGDEGRRPPSLTRILPSSSLPTAMPCTQEEDDIEFAIHIYSSKTATWSCKPASLVANKQHDHDHHLHNFRSEKVITIGGEGGAVAWVDLWCGFLFLQCHDVLKGTTSVPMLHYVQLPPHLVPACRPYDDSCMERDLAFVRGRIRFVHLQSMACPENRYMKQGWTAATYSIAAANPWEVGWQQDGNAIYLDAKCLYANQMLLQQLPNKMPDDSSDDGSMLEPSSSERLCSLSCPMLSLHQDDLLYVMAKVADWDWGVNYISLGLAVDLTKGTLEKVVQVRAERALWGILFFIAPSRISEYLDMDPGSRGRGKRRDRRTNNSKKQHEIPMMK
ncbi:unnamed protein product [Urochloa decumbens]|uniref:DUF1618 domain-containing protein n=1 Tax=Urochloa decumbens TaxID=240449 RepID=A0ABC9GY49_9POAL